MVGAAGGGRPGEGVVVGVGGGDGVDGLHPGETDAGVGAAGDEAGGGAGGVSWSGGTVVRAVEEGAEADAWQNTRVDFAGGTRIARRDFDIDGGSFWGSRVIADSVDDQLVSFALDDLSRAFTR